MNGFERWFCGTSLWRNITRKRLLPWLIAETDLGDHVLELGAGPGATTQELAKLVPRVTAIEYDHAFAASLANRRQSNGVCVVRGDATSLPFPAHTFSSVAAVLVLHHLPSRQAQESAFREIARVLRPGGVLLGFEIQDSWVHRVGHIRSTFVPLTSTDLPSRLQHAGFVQCEIRRGNGGFRFKAIRG